MGTLEKALETVRAKKQSRKLGRYEVDIVHRIQVHTEERSPLYCYLSAIHHTYTHIIILTYIHFTYMYTLIHIYTYIISQPSARQFENAVQVVSQRHRGSPVQALRALQDINIPVFRAQGLTLTRANKEVGIYCINCTYCTV